MNGLKNVLVIISTAVALTVSVQPKVYGMYIIPSRRAMDPKFLLSSIQDMYNTTNHNVAEATELLLKHVADNNIQLGTIKNANGQNILHLACQTDDDADDDSGSPVHDDVIRQRTGPGDIDIVKIILEACKQQPGILLTMLSTKNAWGSTPLHIAAAQGRLEVMKMFIQDLDKDFLEVVMIPDGNKNTVIRRAEINGGKLMTETILEAIHEQTKDLAQDDPRRKVLNKFSRPSSQSIEQKIHDYLAKK